MRWAGWGVWEGRGGVFHSASKGFREKSDRTGCFGKIHRDNKTKVTNYYISIRKTINYCRGEMGAKKRR